jgi:outer membrane biosynthesis protein TonB
MKKLPPKFVICLGASWAVLVCGTLPLMSQTGVAEVVPGTNPPPATQVQQTTTTTTTTQPAPVPVPVPVPVQIQVPATQTVEKTTTVTTPAPVTSQVQKTATLTTVKGTVGEFGAQSIAIETEPGATPVKYVSSETTNYVDEAGNPYDAASLKPGQPVTIHYSKVGDTLFASRIVVSPMPQQR